MTHNHGNRHSVHSAIVKPQIHSFRSKGFALVVTLSLMILLTIIAVGLLSLAGISLRSSSQNQAMESARANARLAMMMALGELQKTAGPDRRVTAPANLVKPTHPEGVTGVWRSWKPAPSGVSNQDYVEAKKGTGFLGYLMSNPYPGVTLDPQMLPVPSTLGSIPLVSTGSLGNNLTNREISAPLIPFKSGMGTTTQSLGSVAWAVLDEGVKSRIDLLPAEEPTGVGDSVTQAGTPARNRFIKVDGMGFLDEPAASLHDSLPKLVTLNEARLKASSQDAVQRFFNDFTVNSSSLQVDVANGGLKTDLSVLFDAEYGATLPAGYSGRYLYSNTTTPFQNATSDSQWELYANYARLYRRTIASDNPKDGLKATLPVATTPPSYLKGINDATLKKTRYEPDMSKVKRPVLMPTVARVDMVFSLVARDNHADTRGGKYKHMLHLMYLPVITLHNPYNVPLRCTNLQVEFANIPIGFQFLINDKPTPTSGLAAFKEMYIWGLGRNKVFNMTLSTSLDSATEVVMKPGETRLFGTPYPKDMTFQRDLNGERRMHDWASNLTGAAKLIPGLMTGPNDGAGFDLDHLVPDLYNRSTDHKARWDNPVLLLLPADKIQVSYGPLIPVDANNTFAITVRLNGTDAAKTQFFYANETKLKAIMEEGTSPRFPEPRSFPALFPAPGASPLNTLSIYEANTTPVSAYVKARPFAIFSVGAKTTVESFTKSRPVADTGAAFQMATCDFINSTSQGTNPLEFAFVPVKNGSAAIESGGPENEQGFLFGGNGSLHGEISATIYEIPMAPLQSIAQLRHANGGSLGSVPYVTYTVGESRAHPALPSDAAFFEVDSSRTVLDHSWLANDRLWDAYWFSTLSSLQGTAYAGASSMTQKELADQFFAGTESLPNKRNIAYQPPGKSATAASADALTVGGRKSAAHIMTQGGFNVNSTSVPAWIAILSGLSQSDIPLATGANEESTGVPFLRVRRPAAASSTFSNKEKLWNGYRSLTSDEVKKLAEEIVAEVRTRGPFLSMSEFVNRRLGSPGGLSNAGAIQAALDRSNVNANMVFNAREVVPAEVAGYGWKNSEAVTGNTGAGAPGEVTQGDVLSAIGSFVSVRSDTFRIRSYGDARDSSGKITASAYCEAVVQRVPEYLDPAESAEAQPTLPSNVNFGRQFKIVSFRWLSPAEI